MTFEVDYIEMPITHICSLHCDGCTAYSNYKIKNTVSIEEGGAWLRHWSSRVKPRTFKILGGEPMLHPSLLEYVCTVRQIWPNCEIVVTTNGMNIDRHPTLPHILSSVGNATVHLTVHSRDEPYLQRLRKAINVTKIWEAEFGIETVYIGSYDLWLRYYQGLGRNMLPFNDQDPAESWRICWSKTCLNLVNNRLWKCPQIGNLQFIVDRFDLRDKPEWEPYLTYNGIGLDCDDETLADFLSRAAGPEPICAMCPAKWETYEKDIYNTDFDLPDVKRIEHRSQISEIFASYPVRELADTRPFT